MRFTAIKLLFTFTRRFGVLVKQQGTELWRRSHTDQRWSWAAHGFVTILAGLVGIPLFGWLLSTHAAFSFTLGVTTMAAYYIGIREQLDERSHREKGDYDTPDSRGITPRVDKAADALAPAFIAMTAWLLWVIGTVF